LGSAGSGGGVGGGVCVDVLQALQGGATVGVESMQTWVICMPVPVWRGARAVYCSAGSAVPPLGHVVKSTTGLYTFTAPGRGWLALKDANHGLAGQLVTLTHHIDLLSHVA